MNIWNIGPHRIICGDSQRPEVVANLFGEEKVDLLWTSPPYAAQRGPLPNWGALMNKTLFPVPYAYRAQILLNLGLVHEMGEVVEYWKDAFDLLRFHGWKKFGHYVWDKIAAAPLSRKDRLYTQHEWIFHINRIPCDLQPTKPNKEVGRLSPPVRQRNAKGELTGTNKNRKIIPPFGIPGSVIRIPRGRVEKIPGVDYDHHSVFPVELAEFVISTFSIPGAVVYDPFMGSGTSLIAAERCGRIFRGIEINEKDCEFAVLRFAHHFPGRY